MSQHAGEAAAQLSTGEAPSANPTPSPSQSSSNEASSNEASPGQAPPSQASSSASPKQAPSMPPPMPSSMPPPPRPPPSSMPPPASTQPLSSQRVLPPPARHQIPPTHPARLRPTINAELERAAFQKPALPPLSTISPQPPTGSNGFITFHSYATGTLRVILLPEMPIAWDAFVRWCYIFESALLELGLYGLVDKEATQPNLAKSNLGGLEIRRMLFLCSWRVLDTISETHLVDHTIVDPLRLYDHIASLIKVVNRA